MAFLATSLLIVLQSLAQPELKGLGEGPLYKSKTNLDVKLLSGEFEQWGKQWKDNTPTVLSFRWRTEYTGVGSAEWQVTLNPSTWHLVAKGNAGPAPKTGKVGFFNINFAHPSLAGSVAKRPVTYYVRIVTYEAIRKPSIQTSRSQESSRPTPKKQQLGVPSVPVRVTLIAQDTPTKFTAIGSLYVSKTEPSELMEDLYPHDIRLYGNGFIPAGTSLETLKQKQKVFMRVGKQGSWVNTKLNIPSSKGWGAKEFSVYWPQGLKPTPGVLQVKVRVHDNESDIFEVPIVPMPPPAKPHIDYVTPVETVMGSTAYYFVLKVYGTGIDEHTKPRFHGQEDISFTKDLIKGRLSFSVPDSFRNIPGRYSIQLVNKQGYSNLVFWDLVVKPNLESLTPASISPSHIQPGAAPLSVKIAFSGSPPKEVWRRVDNGSWKQIPPKNIGSHHVDIELPLYSLETKKMVDLKLSNKAGESNIKTMKVLTPITEKDKKKHMTKPKMKLPKN